LALNPSNGTLTRSGDEPLMIPVMYHAKRSIGDGCDPKDSPFRSIDVFIHVTVVKFMRLSFCYQGNNVTAAFMEEVERESAEERHREREKCCNVL